MQFYKGDRIVCVDADMPPCYGEITIGKEYCVSKDNNNELLVYIINNLNHEACYRGKRFQLTTQNKPTISKPVAKMLVLSVARRLSIALEFIDIGDNYMVLRFVSDMFATVSPKRRQEVISEAFLIYATKVVEQYELIFETFTPHELLQLGST